MKVLILDNFDSFTFMLTDYVEQCGASCEVVRNNHPQLMDLVNQADALVISPGPGKPEEANLLMPILQKYALIKPILGVCLGHQAIGVFFGLTLKKALIPKHGKIDTLTHFDAVEMFANTPHTFNITRYHSLILTGQSPHVLVTGVSSTGEIMSIKHQNLPVWGVQYHPESCTTEHGIQLIKNFLQCAQQSKK